MPILRATSRPRLKVTGNPWNRRRGIDPGFLGFDAAERVGLTAYQMLETISQQKEDPEIAISVVTVLELAHGITRADTPQRRAGRQQFLDDLLAGMPVHPVTVAIALRAGQTGRADASNRQAYRASGSVDRINRAGARLLRGDRQRATL